LLNADQTSLEAVLLVAAKAVGDLQREASPTRFLPGSAYL